MSEAKKNDMLKGALFVLGVWILGEVIVRPVVNKAMQAVTPKKANGAPGVPFIQL